MKKNLLIFKDELKKENGFSLIELMVVVMITILLVGFVGWNYLQYRDRAAVEGSARILRSFINDAKDNAKNGRYGSAEYAASDVFSTVKNFCYVGDLSAPSTSTSDQKTSKSCVPITVDPSRTNIDDYASPLERIASGGIALDNWNVWFDPDPENPGRLEMRVLCKRRPRCKGDEFSVNIGGNYFFPDVDASTVDRIAYLESNVEIKKPYLRTNPNDLKNWIELMPLYLAVKSPLDVLKSQVDFGSSCYGEEKNELVIGDMDGRYLYKMAVGLGGDISEGCFCNGSAPATVNNDSTACTAMVGTGPCAECAPR